jgi:hypothetical protein
MSIHVLHERTNHGVHVTLIWNSGNGYVFVTVRDRGTGDRFVLAPDPADALDAFYHPYCYVDPPAFAEQRAA